MNQAALQLREHMNKFGIEIAEDQVCIFKKDQTKHEALERLITATAQNPVVTDCEAFEKAIYERESVMSTGIGDGIAIPHVRIPEVTGPTLGVGISKKGIGFDALDNNPVHVLVLFATPEGSDKEYLGLLAQVMLSLRNKELFEKLIACKTSTDACAILNG